MRHRVNPVNDVYRAACKVENQRSSLEHLCVPGLGQEVRNLPSRTLACASIHIRVKAALEWRNQKLAAENRNFIHNAIEAVLEDPLVILK